MEPVKPEETAAPEVPKDAAEAPTEDFVINPNFFQNNTNQELNYAKVMEKFGVSPLTPELIERFEKITGHKAHRFLRRGIFFSHRDFNVFLNHLEAKKPVFLYTGRGPSTDAMHLGHLLPFIITKWLQDVLGCPLVIQITDDEKFFYQKPDQKQEDLTYFSTIADENIKDIIAVGFDPEKTFIFKNTEYIPYLYPNICRLQKAITYNQIKGIFGLNGSENSGKVAFPANQAAPCMASCFPHIFGDRNEAMCMIPMGIDQDPYFRMTRDVAFKLQFPKPVCFYSKFFPALQGFSQKMSSSDATSAIFLKDTPKQIKDKINKYAFSGGKATVEEHRALGGDCSVDIAYHYLKYFFDDDAVFEEIGQKYTKGEMLTGELKKFTIEVVQKVVANHQEAKSKISDDFFRSFMKIRPMLKK